MQQFQRIKNMCDMFSSYWKHVLWQASGNAAAQIIGILGIPILTRLYSPEQFSVQGLFIQVVMLLTGLVTWRYEYFIQLPEKDCDSRNVQRIVALLGGCFVIIMTPLVFLFRYKISRFLGNEDISSWITGAPVTAFLVSWALAMQHRAQRGNDFKSSGISEVVGKFSYILSGIGGWLFNLGGGLIAGTAFSALGKSIWLYQKRKTDTPIFEVQIKEILIQFRKYKNLSKSLVLSHLLTTIASFSPLIAIGSMYGENALGQFSLVLSTIFLPSSFLGMAIGQAYYQSAAKIWAQKKSIEPLWIETSKKLILIGIPLYLLVALASPYAYPLIFGHAWENAGYIAAWLSIAAFFSFVSSPLDRTCIIVGAWIYPIAWHAFRALSTLLIICLAFFQNWSINIFIPALVAQMSIAYIIDILMEKYFSRKIHE